MNTRKQSDVIRRYKIAMYVAQVAMGKETRRRVRGDGPARWNSQDDPLAWWCLTELLVNGVK
jgi:hypothetical protein